MKNAYDAGYRCGQRRRRRRRRRLMLKGTHTKEDEKTLKSSRNRHNVFPPYHKCFDEEREMKYNVWSKHDREWSERILRALYERAVQSISSSSSSVNSNKRIPKIVHQIWLGSPLPEKFRYLREVMIRVLKPSNWRFILWDEISIEIFKLKNKKAYDAAKNYGEKSDIARYEILYEMGGIYLDTDMEIYRSFDSIHSHFEFYTGIANTGTIELNNALISSIPGHSILRECIERIRHNHQESEKTSNIMGLLGNFLSQSSSSSPASMLCLQNISNKNKDDPMSTIARTGPGMFTRAFMKVIQDSGACCCKSGSIVAFPPSFFYPFPNNKIEAIDVEKREAMYRHEESFCTHHWAATWNSKNMSRHVWK